MVDTEIILEIIKLCGLVFKYGKTSLKVQDITFINQALSIEII